MWADSGYFGADRRRDSLLPLNLRTTVSGNILRIITDDRIHLATRWLLALGTISAS
jgi:hypothetical protein